MTGSDLDLRRHSRRAAGATLRSAGRDGEAAGAGGPQFFFPIRIIRIGIIIGIIREKIPWMIKEM